MANPYWIISNTGAIGGGKRVRIWLATLRPLSGDDMPVISVSNSRKLAAMDDDTERLSVQAYARVVETDALYWNLDELKAIRRNPSAAARKLKVQLQDGTTIWDALWVTAWAPKTAFGTTIDGTEGWWSMDIELVKYQ